MANELHHTLYATAKGGSPLTGPEYGAKDAHRIDGAVVGDLLYVDDVVGSPRALAIGSAGQVLTTSSGLPAWATLFASAQNVSDDILFSWGDGNDTVSLNRSTSLAADTALTNVLVGTPVTSAVAANSFVLSNITASGDFLFAGNRGGNSEEFLFFDSSAGVLYLSGYNGGVSLVLDADPDAPDAGYAMVWGNAAGSIRGLIVENDDNTNVASDAELLIRSGGASGGDPQLRFLIEGEQNFTIGLENASSDGLTFSAGAALSINPRLIMATSGATFSFQQAVEVNTASGTNLTLNAQGAGDLILQTGGVTLLTLDGGNDSLIAAAGIRIGADSGDNEIDDATQGAASTTLYIGNSSIDVTSDVRVKSDIELWDGQATVLLNMIPVKSFDYDSHVPFGGIYDGKYVGLMAQDVYRVAPWAVNTQGGAYCRNCLNGVDCSTHSNPWTVKADLLTGMIVKGIQELTERVKILED